jgi:hypothetical protein
MMKGMLYLPNNITWKEDTVVATAVCIVLFSMKVFPSRDEANCFAGKIKGILVNSSNALFNPVIWYIMGNGLPTG